MNGIVVNISPVALHLGHLEIRWYSIFVILAFAVGTIVAVKRCKRVGMSADRVYTLVMLVALGGLIGARLFHILDHLGYYMENPRQMIGFSGLAIWGGLVGGGLATFIYARATKVPLRELADAVVPAVLAGQIIGRFACIVNGDAWGAPTTLPWGFIYVNPEAMIPEQLKGIPTHPYVVYEQLWNILTLVAVLVIGRRLKAPGAVFLIYVSAYSIGR